MISCSSIVLSSSATEQKKTLTIKTIETEKNQHNNKQIPSSSPREDLAFLFLAGDTNSYNKIKHLSKIAIAFVDIIFCMKALTSTLTPVDCPDTANTAQCWNYIATQLSLALKTRKQFKIGGKQLSIPLAFCMQRDFSLFSYISNWSLISTTWWEE